MQVIKVTIIVLWVARYRLSHPLGKGGGKRKYGFAFFIQCTVRKTTPGGASIETI